MGLTSLIHATTYFIIFYQGQSCCQIMMGVMKGQHVVSYFMQCCIFPPARWYLWIFFLRNQNNSVMVIMYNDSRKRGAISCFTLNSSMSLTALISALCPELLITGNAFHGYMLFICINIIFFQNTPGWDLQDYFPDSNCIAKFLNVWK